MRVGSLSLEKLTVTQLSNRQFFRNSAVFDLYDIISLKHGITSKSGSAMRSAMFVLTDKLPNGPYRPVDVTFYENAVTRADSPNAARLYAEALLKNHSLRNTCVIYADAWISADTIKKIYLEEQSAYFEAAGGKSRYKIANRHSFRLVTEVVNLFSQEKGKLNYQHAHAILQKAGKIGGKADGFRKKYQRACEILGLPLDINDVVEALRKHQ